MNLLEHIYQNLDGTLAFSPRGMQAGSMPQVCCQI